MVRGMREWRELNNTFRDSSEERIRMLSLPFSTYTYTYPSYLAGQCEVTRRGLGRCCRYNAVFVMAASGPTTCQKNRSHSSGPALHLRPAFVSLGAIDGVSWSPGVKRGNWNGN